MRPCASRPPARYFLRDATPDAGHRRGRCSTPWIAANIEIQEAQGQGMTTPLLSIRNLSIDFHADAGDFRAVNGLSFDIAPGRTVAVVGESGSGKSVTAQAILRILPKAARISGGAILFSDPAKNRSPLDIVQLNPDGERMRRLRGGRIAMIFQEPMTSLSPLHTVGDQVGEALRLHAKVD